MFLRLEKNELTWEFMWIYLSVTIVSLTILTVAMNIYQGFTISNKGINFQVFIFWRFFISWEEIISIERFDLPLHKLSGYQGALYQFPIGYHVIITKRLTLFHRLLGILLGKSMKPAFIIHKGLINHDEAIEMLQGKINP